MFSPDFSLFRNGFFENCGLGFGSNCFSSSKLTDLRLCCRHIALGGKDTLTVWRFTTADCVEKESSFLPVIVQYKYTSRNTLEYHRLNALW